MSKGPNLRLEAAFFFAAACLVMVLAANYQIILDDLGALFGVEGCVGTGQSIRVVMVGFIVAAVAYGGAVVVIVPAYAFLAAVVQHREDSAGEEERRGRERSGGEARPRAGVASSGAKPSAKRRSKRQRKR